MPDDTPLDDLLSDRAAAFDTLAEAWTKQEMDDEPVSATLLGADGDHGSFGDWSAEAIEHREKANRRWLDEFSRFDAGLLDNRRQVDLELLVSGIQGREVYADWSQWRRDPATYLDQILHGVFALFLNPLFPEPETVGYAVSRLREVPQVVFDGMTNLDMELANPLICERGLGQCQAAVAYFRKLLPAEVKDESLRTQVAQAGELAASAMEKFAEELRKLVEGGKGTYALGEERYTRLLIDKERLSYGAEELHKRGETVWAELDEEMRAVAHEVDPSAPGWREVVGALNADHPATFDEMLESYAEWTERARRFCADRGLVTFPDGEKCIVEPSPPFQRPILAVASYAQPPALRPGRTGHFFVPWPPDGTSEEDAAKRLESNGFHSIPTISVHEAYPGHHWHLTWMKDNPSQVRQMIWSSYFAEGWALYTELMMREQGFFEDRRAELCHLDARIFRAARIIVDTGLHTGELTVDQAVEIMQTRASLPGPVARAEVGRYCAWPTQAPSYLTGSLEIERMRERYMDAKRGDLHSFHDELCATGSMPLGLAEKALFGS
jgi:uncharacterized protein (DUF885 family)